MAGADVFRSVVAMALVMASDSLGLAYAVLAQIALAPLAGLVISRYGVEVPFAVNAATFVASALLLIGLSAGRAPADPVAFYPSRGVTASSPSR